MLAAVSGMIGTVASRLARIIDRARVIDPVVVPSDQSPLFEFGHIGVDPLVVPFDRERQTSNRQPWMLGDEAQHLDALLG